MTGHAKSLNLPYIYPTGCTRPEKYLYPRVEEVEQIANTLIPSRLPDDA